MTDARLQEIREQNQYLRKIGHQRVMQEELVQALDESVETERLRCRRIAEACHDSGGGYKPGSRDARIYHYGIDAVVNALALTQMINWMRRAVQEHEHLCEREAAK